MRKVSVLIGAVLVLSLLLGSAVVIAAPEGNPQVDVDSLTPTDVPDNVPADNFRSPPPNSPELLNNGDPVPEDAQAANE